MKENPEKMREFARQCRAMVAGTATKETRAALIDLAEQYERKAEKLDREAAKRKPE